MPIDRYYIFIRSIHRKHICVIFCGFQLLQDIFSASHDTQKDAWQCIACDLIWDGAEGPLDQIRKLQAEIDLYITRLEEVGMA